MDSEIPICLRFTSGVEVGLWEVLTSMQLDTRDSEEEVEGNQSTRNSVCAKFTGLALATESFSRNNVLGTQKPSYVIESGPGVDD